jgi:hypothetical protein
LGASASVWIPLPARRNGREQGDGVTDRRQRSKPLDDHAWPDAAGVEVTGYPVAEGFAEIACFV